MSCPWRDADTRSARDTKQRSRARRASHQMEVPAMCTPLRQTTAWSASPAVARNLPFRPTMTPCHARTAPAIAGRSRARMTSLLAMGSAGLLLAVACGDSGGGGGADAAPPLPDPIGAFPADFLWGTAIAPYQVEGDLHATDWYQWEGLCDHCSG